MGGYAFNVWTVYLLFIIFLTANLLFPLLKRKQIVRDLKRRYLLSKDSNDSSRSAGDSP
ncbi:MAG: heme exporter protein CcmD [Gammaproteobacteria bacterium]